MPNDTHNLLLSLPKVTHRKLKRMADKSLRSVRAEILVAVNEHIAADAVPAAQAQPLTDAGAGKEQK